MNPIRHPPGRAAALLFLVLTLPYPGAAQQRPAAPNGAVQVLTAPPAIDAEHKALLAALAKAQMAGGRTGAAAKELEKLLTPHFAKEEQFALPPLGLLSSLAAGAMPADPESVIRMTERLKSERREMLREHRAIGEALQRLRGAARIDANREATQFADDLLAHADEEEQILYPSAILVGEYLKARRSNP